MSDDTQSTEAPLNEPAPDPRIRRMRMAKESVGSSEDKGTNESK